MHLRGDTDAQIQQRCAQDDITDRMRATHLIPALTITSLTPTLPEDVKDFLDQFKAVHSPTALENALQTELSQAIIHQVISRPWGCHETFSCLDIVESLPQEPDTIFKMMYNLQLRGLGDFQVRATLTGFQPLASQEPWVNLDSPELTTIIESPAK